MVRKTSVPYGGAVIFFCRAAQAGVAGVSAGHMASVCVADDLLVVLARFLGGSCQLEPLLMSLLRSVGLLIGKGGCSTCHLGLCLVFISSSFVGFFFL